MLLTDQEIHEIGFAADCKVFVNELPHVARAFARAVESAVLAKLAQGVEMPEAVGVVRQLHMVEVRFNTSTSYGCDIPDGTSIHTADQLQAYGAACRVKALEDAEQACEYLCAKFFDHAKPPYKNCAKAIRALKGAA